MKKYLILTQMTVKISLNYKANLVFQFIGNILGLFLLSSIWLNISGLSGDMKTLQLFSVLISTEILILNETWLEYDFEAKIKNGNIIFEFTKPVKIIWTTFFRNLGFIITNFCIVLLPLICLILFGVNKNIIHGFNVLFFIVGVLLSLVINYLLSLIIGIVAISVKSVWGILIFKDVFIALFAGVLIPITLYPNFIQKIILLLPVYSIYQIPQEILLGKFDIPVIGTIYQILWILLLGLFAHKLLTKNLQKITYFGG